jgi:hypothetical protein
VAGIASRGGRNPTAFPAPDVSHDIRPLGNHGIMGPMPELSLLCFLNQAEAVGYLQKTCVPPSGRCDAARPCFSVAAGTGPTGEGKFCGGGPGTTGHRAVSRRGAGIRGAVAATEVGSRRARRLRVERPLRDGRSRSAARHAVPQVTTSSPRASPISISTPKASIFRQLPLRGKTMAIERPPLVRFAAVTRPPSSSMLRRTIQRPRPEWPVGGVTLGIGCKTGWIGREEK